VLRALNRAFPITDNQGKFFTIWYGVFNTRTRQLEYACGGHHPAVLFAPGNETPVELGMHGFMIGVVDDAEFESASATIAPGSRMYIFSDGLFEVHDPEGKEMLWMSGLTEQLREAHTRDSERLETILAGIRRWQGADEFKDDYSLIEITFT
jgi:sigma-B regulation protein RsbU (phosphoserine phosphatase)